MIQPGATKGRPCKDPMAEPPDSAFAAPTAAPQNPYASPKATVVHEGGSGGAELAARSQRLSAAIMDYLIFFVPLGVALIPMFMASGRLVANGVIAGLLVGGLALLAIVINNCLLLARNGQTIGKKAVGIRVVRTDGSDAGFVRLFFLRGGLSWVLAAIPGIGNLYALIDVLFIFREDRRCLHDLIADTKVVEAE
jgi:uncharacterized RDD family membrane protein YckC